MVDTTDRYPSDPGNPGARLEERLRRLEQELRAMQGRNPLNNAVFAGTLRRVDEAGNTLVQLGDGGFTMFDADGEPRVIIGLTSSGRYGIVVLDDDGTTPRLWADERGLLSPYLTVPVVAADDYKAVTSGTFVTSHTAQFELISHQGLYCWVTAVTAVGTVGEFRLRIPFSGAVTDVVSVASGTQATQQFRWLHGLDLSAGPVVVEVQARRVSGTGDVNVYRPPGMSLVAPSLCVADGIA